MRLFCSLQAALKSQGQYISQFYFVFLRTWVNNIFFPVHIAAFKV